MKEFWNAIQFMFAAIGGWLGYFLGGCDGLLYALIAFVAMPNITPHVCRHTYCSNMAKSGMNPKTLQYLMGHSDTGCHRIGDGYLCRHFGHGLS